MGCSRLPGTELMLNGCHCSFCVGEGHGIRQPTETPRKSVHAPRVAARTQTRSRQGGIPGRGRSPPDAQRGLNMQHNTAQGTQQATSQRSANPHHREHRGCSETRRWPSDASGNRERADPAPRAGTERHRAQAAHQHQRKVYGNEQCSHSQYRCCAAPQTPAPAGT